MKNAFRNDECFLNKKMKNEQLILHFFMLLSSFSYLPLYVVEALADVVWEPPLTLALVVRPYQVSSVSVMVGEEKM